MHTSFPFSFAREQLTTFVHSVTHALFIPYDRSMPSATALNQEYVTSMLRYGTTRVSSYNGSCLSGFFFLLPHYLRLFFPLSG